MTEWMLRDTAAAHSLTHATLRYFNMSGTDPLMRSGQSTKCAIHFIKVASEMAPNSLCRSRNQKAPLVAISSCT